jgi:hypothetical protein
MLKILKSCDEVIYPCLRVAGVGATNAAATNARHLFFQQRGLLLQRCRSDLPLPARGWVGATNAAATNATPSLFSAEGSLAATLPMPW